MRLLIPRLLFLILSVGLASAQSLVDPAAEAQPPIHAGIGSSDALGKLPADSDAVLVVPSALPRMAPDLALQVCRGRSVLQAVNLASYSADTFIHVELPDTSQFGDYELQKQYSAPRTLTFKPVRFSGDNFVKVNVIIRLLQSEVDHVQKDDPSLNALTPANYKFSFKGNEQVNGRQVHIYQLKPRHKRPGLFKGRIYLDAYTGSLVRAEGKVAKSPSLFIKKIEFVQDYADVGEFTFPVHLHSEAQTRLIGRAIVDIHISDYQPMPKTERASANSLEGLPSTGSL